MAVASMEPPLSMYTGGSKMKWFKPEFAIIELSSEVTCYRYHR
jgi:hypothetical protein